jgi:hypothetical protein
MSPRRSTTQKEEEIRKAKNTRARELIIARQPIEHAEQSKQTAYRNKTFVEKVQHDALSVHNRHPEDFQSQLDNTTRAYQSAVAILHEVTSKQAPLIQEIRTRYIELFARLERELDELRTIEEAAISEGSLE